MKIKISDKDKSGMEEWWCMWYVCPNCKAGKKDEDEYSSGHIYSSFKFCPDCGIELEWEK